jgi:hypothetical protein
MKRLSIAVAVVLALASPAFAASKKVPVAPASPIATVTPVPDIARNQDGVPQPSAAPTCVYGRATIFGDPAGCLYSCNSNIRRIITGNSCVFPTPDTASTPVAP